VDNVSLIVQPGEILGFLGPNGAGKSTTMKMLAGFLTPTAGTAVVCGHDVRTDPLEVKRCVGYLPEGAPLYPDMTPRSLLEFVAAARGLTGAAGKARVEDAMRRVELLDDQNKRIETLSKGFKRRVGLAQAILHDPPVLILDEPTDGLDPNQKHEVRSLIRAMAAGKVIVLSTHILEEVDSVCTRAVIIAEGRLRFDGTPAELRNRSRHFNAVELHVRSAPADAERALERLDGVGGVEPVDAPDGYTGWLIFPETKASILGVVSSLAHDNGWEVEHLHVDRGRLDDVFRVITRPPAEAR
jgi:ABC-2 type transport system ATP-binding protein